MNIILTLVVVVCGILCLGLLWRAELERTRRQQRLHAVWDEVHASLKRTLNHFEDLDRIRKENRK